MVFLLVCLIILLGVTIAGAAWFFVLQPDAVKSNSTQTTTNTSTNNTATNTTHSTTNTTTSNNDGGKSSTSGNVTVTTPADGDEVATVFNVEGFANVFENVINLRVKDDKGNILAETHGDVLSEDTGKTGPFLVRMILDKEPATKKGTLQVFTYSAKDGSEQDMVEIEVTFADKN